MGLSDSLRAFFSGFKNGWNHRKLRYHPETCGKGTPKGSFHYRYLQLDEVVLQLSTSGALFIPFLWDFWESDVPHPATRQPYTNAPEDVDDHGEAVHCTKYLQTDAGQKKGGYRTNITHISYI